MAHHEFALKPTGEQQKILESLVEGPTLIQRMLAMHGSPVCTLSEAAGFLDRHWPRLAPYMFQRGGRPPKDTELLILQLASRPLDAFKLDFAGDCYLTPDQMVRLPIRGVGPIPVEDALALAAARDGGDCSNAFGLVSSAHGFSVTVYIHARPVECELEWTRVSPVRTRTPQHQQAPRREQTRRHQQIQRGTGMQLRDFLYYFEKRIADQIKADQRAWVGKTVRFGELSGRPVSGGAFELGRRR